MEQARHNSATNRASFAHTRVYNHAITLAIAVWSRHEKGPTLREAMKALRKRVAELERDPQEANEALLSEVPFDTYDEIRPTSAAACERIMVEQYGSHCADPSEHSEP